MVSQEQEGPKPILNVTDENRFKGTLFIEAYDEMIDSISGEAETETERALDITFNTIGAVSSTVMLAVDPLGSLFGAGVGWLIEHVSFLRAPLDMLMGNPDEIQAHVQATTKQAVETRVLAEDHRKWLATFDGWAGPAADAFRADMELLGRELDTMAKAVETKAKVVAVNGVLVTVLRDIVRDLIAQLIGSLIGGAVVALAAAAFTAGASLAIFAGIAVAKATALAVNIAARIARVVAALTRQMGRIDKLDDIVRKLGKGWDRFENAADGGEIIYEGWKGAKGVDRAVDKALA